MEFVKGEMVTLKYYDNEKNIKIISGKVLEAGRDHLKIKYFCYIVILALNTQKT